MGHARQVPEGSTIDVVAPASPFDVAGFEAGLERLRFEGFVPRTRPDVTEVAGMFAGNDVRRRQELVGALEARDSAAIWCVRGGYGASRLLPFVDTDLVRLRAKLLVGFSDITALHARWWQAGIPSIHGSMVARLAKEPDLTRHRLLKLLRTGHASTLHGKSLVRGSAQGKLFGGNLALLAAICGTDAQPDLKGALVFIEDIGERPYRIDRMLVQCRQAHLFDGIAGLVFGDFTNCEEPDGSVTVEEVIQDLAISLGVPAAQGFPCGHGVVNEALALGVEYRLDGTTGSLEQLGSLYPEGVSA